MLEIRAMESGSNFHKKTRKSMDKMRDLFYKLSIVLAKRKNNRQKERFFNALKRYFKTLGKDCQMVVGKSGTRKVRHIVIGDVRKAKVVFINSYATPDKMLIPRYRLYPLDRKKNKYDELINLSMHFLVIVVLIALALAAYFYLNSSTGISRIVKPMSIIFALLAAYQVSQGLPAYINYSQAGALTVILSIAEKANNEVAAYILFDNGASSSVIDQKDLIDMFPLLERKRLILIEHLAEGDTVLVAHSLERTEKGILASNLDKVSENGRNLIIKDMNGSEDFIKGIYVCSGYRDSHGEVYVKDARSNKNRKVDFDLLKETEQGLLDYLNSFR